MRIFFNGAKELYSSSGSEESDAGIYPVERDGRNVVLFGSFGENDSDLIVDNSRSESSCSDSMSLSGTGASERINPGEWVGCRDGIVEWGTDAANEDVQQRAYRRVDFYVRNSLQKGEHRETIISLMELTVHLCNLKFFLQP